MSMEVPLLNTIENISFPGALAELRSFFAGPAARFKVHLDDACAQPADWRNTWASPLQWGLAGEKNWPTKYAAAGFIPRMISVSPFLTEDWREASASVGQHVPSWKHCAEVEALCWRRPARGRCSGARLALPLSGAGAASPSLDACGSALCRLAPRGMSELSKLKEVPC